MSYLLDTNVLSEFVSARPESRVLEWLRFVPEDTLYLSVLSLGEIRKGLERLRDERRRERIRLWLEHELPTRFGDRLLPVTAAVADRWGRLVADAGRSMPAIDSLLAATALHHGLRMVTRNQRDFEVAGLDLINPWIS